MTNKGEMFVTYQFKHSEMEFSKDGQLDELIALDRYAVPSYEDYKVGDTVVAIVDKSMGTKRVCEIIELLIETKEYKLKDRFGEEHIIQEELMHKPLETKPAQMWERWAKGAASVELEKDRDYWEFNFRELLDGYGYSLGGRIQLMLGQEFVTGKKANLTAYNCYVIPSASGYDDSLKQFLEVIRVADVEANVMRRGGGVGTNVSFINDTKGSGKTKKHFILNLPHTHKDSEELQDRIKLDKFENVTITTNSNPDGYEIVVDSVEGLFSSLKKMVIDAYDKNVSEIKLSFKDVRHRDAIVKGVNGRSSGSVSWMELFDLVAGLLQQETIDNIEFAEIFSFIVGLIIQGGSRRGALMLVCNDDNKNVRKFIERKKKAGFLSGANISVGISDSFMDRVKSYNNGYKTPENEESYGLWRLIVESAHASAEPGVIFLERYNKESNSWYYDEIHATNPCFTGDMKLLTTEGYKTFEELSGKEVGLINYIGQKSHGKVWETGTKDIVKVRLSNKKVITCTPDHRFMLIDGSESKAIDLKGKVIRPYINENSNLDEFYVKLGYIQGDGGLTDLNNPTKKGISINIGQKDDDVALLFGVDPKEGRTYYINEFNDKLKELGFSSKVLPERTFPFSYDDWDDEQKLSFLKGCYSANGSVIRGKRVAYKTTSVKFADKLKEELEKLLGINVYITTNKPKKVKFKNGEYECKQSYDVNISNYLGVLSFYNNIGFVHKYKMDDCLNILLTAAPYVLSVKDFGKEVVYDFNEPKTNWGVVEGFVAHNCGEQGLPEYSVCNLGHFVLPTYFDEENKDVDWLKLQNAVHTAVRMQDNIIDYTPYFLEENRKQQLGERRVGIGSLGLGTLMIKLGLGYGSDKGNEFVEKLYKFITLEAYKASIDIAEEKGAFLEFNHNEFIESGFMQKLYSELPKEYQDKLLRTGIRNVTIVTQAPTGSTGTYIDNIPYFREVFGGTTTGIEPYFSWEYWRAGRLGVNKQTVHVAEKYMKENNIKDVSDLPDYYVTAMDLSPEDHVKVQAAIQKWTDSSISKTANCPSDYTIEQTEDLYMLSYDLGLKGMTIYRDGSRDAQVLATKEEDAKLETHIEAEKLKGIKSSELKLSVEVKNTFEIKKRPKRLYGFTEKVGFSYGDKFGKAYVTVNLSDGDVWEVFVQTKVKEVSSLAKSLGLMTTKMIRLGGTSDNLQQAIDTLSYDQVMGTLPMGIANILKQLQKERLELEVKTTKKEFELMECAECGEKAYDKGNCICHSCGQSKCN